MGIPAGLFKDVFMTVLMVKRSFTELNMDIDAPLQSKKI